ncbi:hypothetical protein MRX96_039010 [Rhipicephalus microplus]
MQSEETRIHLLHEKVSGTLKCILECYIKRDYLEATPLSDVQYKDPAKFLPLEEIYLGAKPTAALSGGTHGLNDDQIHNFRLRCLEFFIEAARQIYLRFPLKSHQLKNLRVLDPKVVMGKTIPSIAPLAVSFPLIVRENEVNKLDREWRLLRNMDLSEHAGLTASQFWHAVCELHFREEDIIREASHTDVTTGRTITVPLSHVRLRPDAVPSKFPSCPTYLSRETTRREDPDSKRARMEHAAMQKAIAESEEMFNRAHEEDKVHSLGELIGHLRSKEMKFWNIIEKEERLVIIHIVDDEAPWLKYSVCVKGDMSVTVHVMKTAVEALHPSCNVVVSSETLSKIQEVLPILVYVAGYAVYATLKRLNCAKCKDVLTVNKTITVSAAHEHYDLVKQLDRGGLVYPSMFALNAVAHCYVVVEQLATQPELLLMREQHQVVTELTLHLLANEEPSDFDTSRLGYAALVPDPPYCGLIPIPPHQDPGLEINTTIPGIRSKKHTPWSALHQEAVATIEERLAGRVLLYTDGSVTADGSVAAACFAPSLGIRVKCRLPLSASSTAAELPVGSSEETIEHILLHCPGYTEQRRRLFDAYGRLGLPHVSLDHLRFPQAPRSSLMRAFEALLEFFGDAALIVRL